MGFLLKRLELHDFRNHQALSFTSDAGVIVVVGANASGKSSILEAIQLLCGFDSFRTSSWHDLVRINQETCRIIGDFQEADRSYNVEMLVVDGKRQYLFNGKKRRLGDMTGVIPIVLFTPDDLDLIKGAPEQRRLCFDSIGKRLSKQYKKIYQDYAKTLSQRNSILRERQKNRMIDEPPRPEELVWEEHLADLGALLTVNRYKLYSRLMKYAKEHYAHLSGGETLDSAYLPSYDKNEAIGLLHIPETNEVKSLMLEAMETRRREEYLRGVSLVGPQRDEISFFVDGREARSYASQGQQRSVALALKMAELDVCRDITANDAILLLDDVLSELDLTRRQSLLSLSSNVGQCFITTADLRVIPDQFLSSANIIELKR
ncbi:MAG: DNA replication and repair protein RecF [Coriobacteriia bacterium]|nr:DNA replication and repair protein RecF [Coriobacteriia bacterium]